MPDNPDPLSTFTFRVASRVSSHILGLTSHAETVGESKSKVHGATGAKRERLRVLIRKFGSRNRKRAEGKSKRVSVGDSKQVDAQPVKCTADTEDVNTTFATEDCSISVTSDSPLLNSPSETARKRKRFAGIWEDLDVALQINAAQMNAEKRARTNSATKLEEFKENIGPSTKF